MLVLALYLAVCIPMMLSIPRRQPWSETKDFLIAALVWPVLLACVLIAFWQKHRERKTS